MKVVTKESLKAFLDYLHKNFMSPYAVRDGDGNEIKSTYLRIHGQADSATHADKADISSACTGNSATADIAGKLKNARSIKLTGEIVGTADFDGSSDISIATSFNSSSVNDISAIREESDTKISAVRSDFNKKIGEVRTEVSDKATEISGKIDDESKKRETQDAELEKEIQDTQLNAAAYQKSSAYQQATKLDATAYKSLEIPLKRSEEYLRRPFQVLKLLDDGLSDTTVACTFPNGDESDFSDVDAYDFKDGSMKLRTRFEIPMSEQVALGSGFVSSTNGFIDMNDYENIKGVEIL